MNNKFLFNLAGNDKRSVYEDDRGVLLITSQASDEYKRRYDAFVYDLHDGNVTSCLRRFFNKQYALFFSRRPNFLTKIFGAVFLPFYQIGGSGKFLDVGCSTGLFLESLPKTWERYGVELNTKAVNIARKKGLNVKECALESCEYNEKFDVVRISHVIEHIENPEKFLSTAADFLKQGGHLVIYTPNSNSLSFKLTGKFWASFYDKTHFTIFNLTNLSNIAKDVGLETVFSGSYYTGSLGESIVRAIGIKKGWVMAVRVLQILLFPFSFVERIFNRSDALVVYFRKI